MIRESTMVFVCGALTVFLAAAAAAVPVDADWGKSEGGVRIRARVEKQVWSMDEEPALTIDLSSDRPAHLSVPRIPYCEVQVDAIWYVSRNLQPVAGYIESGPGIDWERWTTVKLDGAVWVVKPKDYKRGRPIREAETTKQLHLSAGRHTIRVACHIEKLEPISNQVSIEVR